MTKNYPEFIKNPTKKQFYSTISLYLNLKQLRVLLKIYENMKVTEKNIHYLRNTKTLHVLRKSIN